MNSNFKKNLMNSDLKFTLEKTPFHFLLNQFYKMVDKKGYEEAILYMEETYLLHWAEHWEDVMLAYDYEFNNLKRGVE
jgi:hypothetical protein